MNADELKTLFDGLTEAITKAIKPEVPEAKADDDKGNEQTQDPDALAKAFEPVTAKLTEISDVINGEDGVLAKVAKLVEDGEATRDALDKALDRVATIEGALTVKKSIDGGDGSEEKKNDLGSAVGRIARRSRVDVS